MLKRMRKSTTASYLIPCFSGTLASPNKVFMSLRINVTVTVTIAPAVTTFVFSSSITNRKIYVFKIDYQILKCILFFTFAAN